MALAVTLSSARSRLGELVHRTRAGRERVVLTDHGMPVAALISVEDLARLESLTQTREPGVTGGSPIAAGGIPHDRIVAALDALDAADAAETSELAAALLAPHADLLEPARQAESPRDAASGPSSAT